MKTLIFQAKKIKPNQHMKPFILLFFLCFLLSCKDNNSTDKSSAVSDADTVKQKELISATLDSFNVAAANADFTGYFNFFAPNATFIGTDATEHWSKQAFMVWAKPYFDKKTTWNFKAIKRNIYFEQNPAIAWFDELLNTQMKICRGSGVLIKQNNGWKIQQYVLSMTFPNEKIKDVLQIKAPIEDSLIKSFSEK